MYLAFIILIQASITLIPSDLQIDPDHVLAEGIPSSDKLWSFKAEFANSFDALRVSHRNIKKFKSEVFEWKKGRLFNSDFVIVRSFIATFNY